MHNEQIEIISITLYANEKEIRFKQRQKSRV